MKLEQIDRNKILPLLNELTNAVEDLLVTGLTTASDATLKTLNVTFQETSRMGLLRLGTTLRAVNEEVSRFTKDESDFSRKRLSFFLNRSWLLGHAIKKAIEENDGPRFESLMLSSTPKPVDKVEVVTIGVVKRTAASFCAFDFRLRVTAQLEPFNVGDKLVWSCVFPRVPNSDIPPEGYLHLPQKQKFKAVSFLEPKRMTIEKCNMAVDATGVTRISLTEASTVSQGAEYSDWQAFWHWDRESALQRVVGHNPGPFDLEVELQEEVFFEEWCIESFHETDEGKGLVFPILTESLQCEANIPKHQDQSAIGEELTALASAKKTPGQLFGLLHYERCKLILQPLTVFGKKGPKHLMISNAQVDPKKLLAAMKF